MELSDILSVLDRFDASAATGLELEMGGVRLKLEKATMAAATAAPVAAPVSVAVAACAPAAPAAAPQEEAVYIKAPLVGAFYAASGPDKAPFAKAGDSVKKGQTVCILEAMKMMSEVSAPMDCVIEEVLLKDGDLAGFDAPIFRVRPI